MQQSTMRIAILLATYNGEKYLSEQLLSLYNQTYSDWTLYIADDGSTDGTIGIVREFSQRYDNIVFHQNSEGKGALRNFMDLLAETEADYYMFCDQDDVWLPNHIKCMAKALETYDWALSDCKIVDEHLNVVGESIFKIRGTKLNIPSNLWSACYQGCCMAFRREVLEKALPFPRTKVGHDLWLGLIANKYFKTTLIREPLLLYRRHGGAISPTGMHKKAFTLLGKIHYRMYIVGHLVKKMASEAMRGNF